MSVFSSSQKKILSAGLLGVFLGACNLPSQPESSASASSPSTSTSISVDAPTLTRTGKAVIRLPAFPAGSLVKSSSQPGAVFGCTFVLTIDIPGRNAPLIRSWNLQTFNGPLVVDHLPVGEAQFSGHLVTVAGDVTHAGSVTAIIAADQMVDVNLDLKSTAVGDAAICVTVEGLPSSVCAVTTPISLRVLSVCWGIHRALANADTGSGVLRVDTGAGDGTTGEINWDGHAADTVSNIWADRKWGMAGFTVDHTVNGAWNYQGPFQQDNSILNGTIQGVNGMQIGTFSAIPMDCPE